MSLKPFTYPFPETRFLHAGPNVYKFKIRYGNSIRGEEVENKEVIVQELEVLAERKAAEAMLKKRKRREVPSSPARPGLDRSVVLGESKVEDFSWSFHQNRERKTQQECQKTPAFDVTDVQDQGRFWEIHICSPLISILSSLVP
uniref:Membrane anchored junction protein n=1 Tax=Capra hircus TaxID=9925 RepID=A0A452EUF2_CAPHI